MSIHNFDFTRLCRYGCEVRTCLLTMLDCLPPSGASEHKHILYDQPLAHKTAMLLLQSILVPA